MAKAQEPMTEQEGGDETPEKQPRRRRFGRRKEAPREMRTDTEWVDTLVAHEGADEEPLAGSPFAAGEDEPESHEMPEAFASGLPELPDEEHGTGELPDEASEVGDEVVLRERQLYRPDKLALENRVRAAHHHRGERDAFYEKSWNRRTAESVEDIHNYIDNVIGTDLEPSRRRERLGRHGITGRRRREMERIGAVQVEGLDEDLMIAFTFPQDEFRGARVVYETEGGYVVEVTRAVGGDDARKETQYYTVSRVGEVAHVLDKMRAAEAERRARAEGVAPVAPVHDPESVEPLDGPAMPDDEGTEAPAEPPGAEDVGAPGAASPESRPEDAPDGTTEEAEGPSATAYGSEPGAAEPPASEETASDEPTSAPGGKGFGGFLKRMKGGEESDDEPADGDADTPEGGGKGIGNLFKRKKEEGAETEAPDAPASEDADGSEKKSGFGSFLKRKKDAEEDASSD